MIKKVNAVLGLLTTALILFHIIYETVSFLTFSYDPFLTSLIAHILTFGVVLHVILSIIMLLFIHDKGNGFKYPKLNIRTLIQRISAVLIIFVTALHVNTFKLMNSVLNDTGTFCLIVISQVLFYAIVLLHISLSFSNSLITLGLISSHKARKRADIASFSLCAFLFAAASFSVIRVIYIFFREGGVP